jgi:hypothetical protein
MLILAEPCLMTTPAQCIPGSSGPVAVTEQEAARVRLVVLHRARYYPRTYNGAANTNPAATRSSQGRVGRANSDELYMNLHLANTGMRLVSYHGRRQNDSDTSGVNSQPWNYHRAHGIPFPH